MMKKFLVLMFLSCALHVCVPAAQAQALRATATAHSVVLSWTLFTPVPAELNASNIYRCTVVTGTSCTPKAPALTSIPYPSSLTYTDLSVTPGTTYGYALTSACPITAVTTATCSGESTMSSPVTMVAVPAPPAPLSFVNSPAPNGTVGVNYSMTLAATGGVAPYVFNISSTIPGTTAPIVGATVVAVPTMAGSFQIAATVTDSSVPPLMIMASYTVVIAAAPPPVVNPIGIKFVGTGTAMATSESAGIVAQSNWNQLNGATGSLIALKDGTGAATQANASFTGTTWKLPTTDTVGNARLMRGYLDDASAQTVTATVAGLPPGTYSVYVYVDGDNATATRVANYALSGTGITSRTIAVTDKASTNFSGTFTSGSNYALFANVALNGGFTITATPVSSSDSTKRAPINAIQIVPVSVVPPPPPPVVITVAPTTAAFVAGSGATRQFTATVTNAANTTVVWSGTGACGAISATGLLTAPATAGTCNVTAISVADATKSASAVVTVTAPPPTLAINCPVAKTALTETNMALGTQITFAVTSNGVTATCTSTW